jgi:hypothetical protein
VDCGLLGYEVMYAIMWAVAMCKTIWCHNPEVHSPHFPCLEFLISCNISTLESVYNMYALYILPASNETVTSMKLIQSAFSLTHSMISVTYVIMVWVAWKENQQTFLYFTLILIHSFKKNFLISVVVSMCETYLSRRKIS